MSRTNSVTLQLSSTGNMNVTKQQLIDNAVLIAAFWSAIIVGVVTFLRDAWVSNNMTEKSRNAILWFMGVLDALVLYVRQELTPIEQVKPAKVTKRTSK